MRQDLKQHQSSARAFYFAFIQLLGDLRLLLVVPCFGMLAILRFAEPGPFTATVYFVLLVIALFGGLAMFRRSSKPPQVEENKQ